MFLCCWTVNELFKILVVLLVALVLVVYILRVDKKQMLSMSLLET